MIDAVHASTRDDVGLLVVSGAGERVPDDPRITVLPYEEVPRAEYDARLRCLDALVLPLDGATYLTTGQVADAVAAGLPSLVSSWPYLAEVLGEAGIPYGDTVGGLTGLVDVLDESTLARAAEAARARRAEQDPSVCGEALFQLLDELCQREPGPP